MDVIFIDADYFRFARRAPAKRDEQRKESENKNSEDNLLGRAPTYLHCGIIIKIKALIWNKNYYS